MSIHNPFIYKLTCLVLVFATGCSDETAPSDIEPITSGPPPYQGTYPELCQPAPEPSKRVVFRFERDGSLGRLPTSHSVFYEHGSRYLIIDDHCHYWAFDSLVGHRGWEDHVRGQLDSTQAKSVLERLRWETWSGSGGGTPHTDGMPVSHPDGTIMSAFGRRYTTACARCDGEMFDPLKAAQDLLAETIANARPVEQPTALRYIMRRVDHQASQTIEFRPMPTSWEFVALTDEELQRDRQPTPTVLRQSNIIEQLWVLRATYKSWSEARWSFVYIPLIDEEGTHYHLYFRPVLEDLEGDDGSIPVLQ